METKPKVENGGEADETAFWKSLKDPKTLTKPIGTAEEKWKLLPAFLKV
tara:strand:+ start:119 stop:265 length:147 start_codon:yes stop_codon:yes gene_type:complete